MSHLYYYFVQLFRQYIFCLSVFQPSQAERFYKLEEKEPENTAHCFNTILHSVFIESIAHNNKTTLKEL